MRRFIEKQQVDQLKPVNQSCLKAVHFVGVPPPELYYSKSLRANHFRKSRYITSITLRQLHHIQTYRTCFTLEWYPSSQDSWYRREQHSELYLIRTNFAFALIYEKTAERNPEKHHSRNFFKTESHSLQIISYPDAEDAAVNTGESEQNLTLKESIIETLTGYGNLIKSILQYWQ